MTLVVLLNSIENIIRALSSPGLAGEEQAVVGLLLHACRLLQRGYTQGLRSLANII
jgi:hypothetical protein